MQPPPPLLSVASWSGTSLDDTQYDAQLKEYERRLYCLLYRTPLTLFQIRDVLPIPHQLLGRSKPSTFLLRRPYLFEQVSAAILEAGLEVGVARLEVENTAHRRM